MSAPSDSTHSADLPRPEHPRPQFVRPTWLTLNGRWQFETDRGDSGLERGLCSRELTGAITVPFCPESELSGIGEVDFLEAVWYRRTVAVPPGWAGLRVLLHFGAVDHDATVWVDGVEVVRHRGGFSSFSADITAALGDRTEPATIVVRARDSRHAIQARGKQSRLYANHDCDYTRTTGIWQSVWLEAVPDVHLQHGVVTPNVGASSFTVEVPVSANRAGWTASATISDAAGEVVSGTVRVDLDRAPTVTLVLPPERVRLWSPADPHLYDLTLTLRDEAGAPIDTVRSYTGLRSVAIDGRAILINGERVFQRLVLDQGYWPDGILTAPDDAALRRDIEASMAAGFNGARLHQKVFEERFYYHADRLGYLVWGEFGDWGANVGRDRDNQQPTASFVTQWLEVLGRDLNHPSIVGWCPLNETYQVLDDRITQLDDVTRGMWLATKLADPTRPVLDASGYSHRVLETEVWDSHDYEQDPATFAANQGGLAAGDPHRNRVEQGEISQPYAGQPYFVSEFGGIWWNPEAAAASGSIRTESWGYGQRVADEAAFYSRFEGLTAVLLADPEMFGYCYTQLTDVFQEENGIYRFDRTSKLDVDRIRAAQLRPAAYELGPDPLDPEP